MNKVIDSKMKFFDRRVPPSDIAELTASIVNSAEYLARCILTRGEVTVSRDKDNPYLPFKLLLKHLDESSQVVNDQ